MADSASSRADAAGELCRLRRWRKKTCDDRQWHVGFCACRCPLGIIQGIQLPLPRWRQAHAIEKETQRQSRGSRCFELVFQTDFLAHCFHAESLSLPTASSSLSFGRRGSSKEPVATVESLPRAVATTRSPGTWKSCEQPGSRAAALCCCCCAFLLAVAETFCARASREAVVAGWVAGPAWAAPAAVCCDSALSSAASRKRASFG